MGRTVRTQSVDSDGDVFTETEFDQMGRPKRVTNPYRTGDTKLWTESFYDDLGRVWKVTTPDNAEVLTDYGLATSGSQIGTAVTVADQAGKLRRSITNALGQLKRVDEPNASNELGAIDDPNQYTVYGYDVLNNLLTVSQGVQTRTFVYDALSRLKSASNPESGTIQYAYDPNGNLTSKTDARSITTTYVYDALNRVTERSYDDNATLPVYYTYDNLSHAMGQLIKVVTGSGSTPFSVSENTEFDAFGRVKKSKQTTDGTVYNEMEYTYNLSGALIEEKYPSGRVVKTVLDNDGDLSMVQSKRNANHGYWNYAHHFSYTAAGAVSSMQLGNGTWETTAFNSRLQPTEIALGRVQNATDLLKLDYTYGVVENNQLNTAKNNGNIQSQTITVQRSNQDPLVLNQSYVYDSLNRLLSAEEIAGGSTAWKQTYLFDRYGNRRFDQANTSFPASFSNTAVSNPAINASDNRFTSGQGYTYS